MESERFTQDLSPWGMKLFDNNFNGLPNLAFNLLRTYNKQSSISAIGHFLQQGLSMEQRVVLVSFENPVYLLNYFKDYGFDFEKSLLEEQLIYLYYKPFFSHSLNFSTNHKNLYNEIRKLSKYNINRIAFLNADALFNIESHLLAESSAQRIVATFCDGEHTVLGSYQATDGLAHKYLHEACEEILNSYIELKPCIDDEDKKYELTLIKSPISHDKKSITLHLTHELGFNFIKKPELIKHG